MLWGFTAILGDLIQLPALQLVWWRVLLTSISLLFFLRPGRIYWKISRPMLVRYSFAGILTGLHWLAFYGSIKMSNASIALICMATCAFFTSLLEPVLMKQKAKWHEIITGFLIIPGMVLIAENIELKMITGFWVGMLASLLAAIFSILNKKWVNQAEPMTITFIEMSAAWVLLSAVMPIYFNRVPGGQFWPGWQDFALLLVLAVFCTTLTWMLALRALKHISAFASTLAVNMEPVYGILLAVLILDDHRELKSGFYWGVLLIMAVVFTFPFINKWFLGKTAK
jgi:drug/metabolite transporter (DMT)-like permease